jgi:hypothetical protein
MNKFSFFQIISFDFFRNHEFFKQKQDELQMYQVQLKNNKENIEQV